METPTSDTAVIIANGPSLKSVPNEWLDKYPTFGSNRVWLKYNPDVLALVDIKMVFTKELQEEALASFEHSKEVYLSKDAADFFPSLPDNVTVLEEWWNYHDEQGGLLPVFSEHPDKALVSGGTITYGLFQLAFWKGFRRLLIVGLNHTFRDSRGDHFDERYNRGVGIPYEIENTENFGKEPGRWFWSEENFVKKTNYFYNVALKYAQTHGREIINCTPDSKCEVFPIDDWRNY